MTVADDVVWALYICRPDECEPQTVADRIGVDVDEAYDALLALAEDGDEVIHRREPAKTGWVGPRDWFHVARDVEV